MVSCLPFKSFASICTICVSNQLMFLINFIDRIAKPVLAIFNRSCYCECETTLCFLKFMYIMIVVLSEKYYVMS